MASAATPRRNGFARVGCAVANFALYRPTGLALASGSLDAPAAPWTHRKRSGSTSDEQAGRFCVWETRLRRRRFSVGHIRRSLKNLFRLSVQHRLALDQAGARMARQSQFFVFVRVNHF
jgi:hypothetical protein